MYDCIVVGAGPAGSSVAFHLARRGHSVLVVEKAALPRYKSCSGAVSPSIAQWFDGVDFAPAIDRTLRRVRYTWKLADEVVGELQTQDPIWVVKRDVFDQFLVQQAIAQGAELRDRTAATGVEFQREHWDLHTPAGTVQGRYLVAADGAEGPMAGWLGFQQATPRSAATLYVPTDAPVAADCALNFEFGLLKQGCLWCVPQQQGYAIGAATFLGKGQRDYDQVLSHYAPDFGVEVTQGQVHPHAVRLWDGQRSLHTRQALVVGEAAAIVDPLTVEGVRHGIYSGVKAAAALHAALQGSPEALAGYSQAMHAWGDNMQWAQRIAAVFFRVPGIGYRVGIKRPTMTTRMGQLLAGEIQYQDIANRVIKRMSTGLIPGRSK